MQPESVVPTPQGEGSKEGMQRWYRQTEEAARIVLAIVGIGAIVAVTLLIAR